ncbi:MAG: DNA primase, partial [Anaerolineales bacterium]
KKEGMDFSQALHLLAEKAGVQLKPPTPQEIEQKEENETLRTILEDAVTFYRHQLLNTSNGKLALDYVHQRGINDETIEAFGLGYAPKSWDALWNYFQAKHVDEDALSAVGLILEGEGGQVRDRFHHRLMIPIRDDQGRMSGFGARILDPNDVPKFLNSPQTVLFDKGKLLFGLDRARRSIRAQDQAVIVEGYLDVITLHQGGFTNVISSMGTALTDQQLFLLKRYTKRLVLALDPDAAGAQATLRGLELARQAMDHTDEPVFDSHGLLKREARLQADIRVAKLPEGLDPDEIVLRDAQEWQHIIQSAQPIVVHVMETLANQIDLNDPKAKEEIAQRVVPLIQEVPSPLERDDYIQRLARLIRVDERTLISSLGVLKKKTSKRQAQIGKTTPSKPLPKISLNKNTNPLEQYILGVLLRDPHLLFLIDRHLLENQLLRLSFNDFHSAEYQMIFQLIQQSLDQDASHPLHYVMNHLSLEMAEIADELLGKNPIANANQQKLLEDILRAIIQLRQQILLQKLEYQRFQLADQQEQAASQIPQIHQAMVQLTQEHLRLDLALKKYTSH